MALTPRQTEIAGLVARGMSNKVIAAKTDLAVETVKVHIKMAAARLPGHESARHKLTIWFLNISDEAKTG